MTKKALSLLLCACLLLVVAPVHAASLRLGDRGSQVTEIQRKLKQWGYYDGNVDGQFGEATQKAVMSFQRKNGLTRRHSRHRHCPGHRHYPQRQYHDFPLFYEQP